MTRRLLLTAGLALAACVGAPPPPPSSGSSGQGTTTTATTPLGSTATSAAATGHGSDRGDESSTTGDDDSNDDGSSGTTGRPPPPPTTTSTTLPTTTGEFPPGDAYGECNDDCLIPDSECLDFAFEDVCAPPCEEDSDCPPPVDDRATAACMMHPTGPGLCVLPCMGFGGCPLGMDCVNDGVDVFGVPICMWD